MTVVMGDRLTQLHDARLVAVRPLIAERVRELAGVASGGSFDEFFDATMRALLVENFRSIGAHEGTVWLLDEGRSALVPRFNSGPNAANFVGRFRQSLRAGMISMVVSTEQPICENEVHQNQQQDKRLDRELGLLTCAMLAVPLYFGSELRGVVSAVQLKPADSVDPEPPGFTPAHLGALQMTSSVLARLIEQHLYTMALGIEDFA